jgi:glycosyltransferase involved in cell wall biosynthesis
MQAPTVSIILPTFNRLKYLRPAVGSILAQTFEDWELIIGDDGSDAETHTFLDTLITLPHVRLLRLSHTGSPGAVRNSALREARGEFVAFLDSDDLWLPSKLDIQIRSLRHRSACQWAYSGFTIVDAAGDPRRDVNDGRWPAPDGWIFEQLLKMEAIVAPSTVVVRRSLIERLGGFDEQLRVCNDYDLWLRLATHSEVDVVKEALVHLRRHNEHYADDITSLEDWRRVLEKTRNAGMDRRLDLIWQREHAKVFTRLARSHAVCGNRLGVLRTLLRSWQYAWRYRQWWSGAISATARVFAPPGMRRVVRRYRRRSADAQAGAKS